MLIATYLQPVAAEIVFGILCGGLACIFGIVWLIQGKKKGGKLIVLAIVSNIIIRGLLFLATGGK